MSTIPEVARPWTDPLGVTWCVTKEDSATNATTVRVYELREKWHYDSTYRVFTINPDLLAGLGRTLPPVPTPKRVAKVVTVVSAKRQYAVRGDVLYSRFAQEHRWELCDGITYKEHILAAAAAFEGAGEILPGEDGSDA